MGRRGFATNNTKVVEEINIIEEQMESTKWLNRILGESNEAKEKSVGIFVGAMSLVILSKLFIDYKQRNRPAEAEESYFQYGVSNITRHDPTG